MNSNAISLQSVNWEAFDRDHDWVPAVNEPLPPIEICRAVIDAPRIAPAGNEAATKLFKILLGSYPERKVNDPEIYARAIVSILAEHSVAIGAKAIDRLTRRSKFYPTRAELAEACADLAGEDNRRRAVAGAMLRAHHRRADEERSRAASDDFKRDLDAHAEARDAWLKVPHLSRPHWLAWRDAWPKVEGLKTMTGGTYSPPTEDAA